MPELPEVETIVRDLAKRIVGRSIVGVDVLDSLVIRNQKPRQFVRLLVGQRILGVTRRGKAIVVALSGGQFLIVQLVMTGQLIYEGRSLHTRLSFLLSNKEYLHYNDQRRFGRLYIVKKLENIAFFRKLGIEPLGGRLTMGWMTTEFKRKKTMIKPLLMNQNFIAGIGNIYASEILFRARIHPQKLSHRLAKKEINALCQATVGVLKEAIALRGSSVNTYRDASGQKGSFVSRIKVYDRKNELCVMCQTPIMRIVQAGRSTFFCPRCQRKGV